MSISATSRAMWAGVGALGVLSLVACASAERAADPAPVAAAATAAPATDSRPAVTGPTGTESMAPQPSGEAWPLVGGGTLDIGTLSDQPLALWFWAPG